MLAQGQPSSSGWEEEFAYRKSSSRSPVCDHYIIIASKKKKKLEGKKDI